jgi:hypothetical protein
VSSEEVQLYLTFDASSCQRAIKTASGWVFGLADRILEKMQLEQSIEEWENEGGALAYVPE